MRTDLDLRASGHTACARARQTSRSSRRARGVGTADRSSYAVSTRVVCASRKQQTSRVDSSTLLLRRKKAEASNSMAEHAAPRSQLRQLLTPICLERFATDELLLFAFCFSAVRMLTCTARELSQRARPFRSCWRTRRETGVGVIRATNLGANPVTDPCEKVPRPTRERSSSVSL